MAELYFELLEIIHSQEEIIKKQIDIVAKLTVENLEKENMIKTLTTN